MPYDIEAYLKEGEAYSLYTDGNGGVFWRRKDDRPNLEEKDVYFGIFKSELQANNVDLPISSYRVDMRYLSGVEEIGNFVWYRPELHKPKQLSLVEEGYIDEVKTYINNGLFEKEKWGEYQLYFGRYEILSSDVRGISVAVVGEETYYLHFWVTKYQDGTFECWPIDGSQVEDDSIDEEKVERIIEYDTISTEMIIKSLWYE